jgi:hypothetical protein
MRSHIGLEVRAHDIRVVMTRSARVVWYATVEFEDIAVLGDVVAKLLAERPPAGRARPRLIVALGYSHAQVKRLDGLPAMRSRVQMTQLLREHAKAAFLSDGASAAIPEVFRAADGKWWGAALDRAVIAATLAGARRAGFGVESIVPTVCALARVSPDSSALIDDGRATIAVAVVGGELREVCRASRGGEDSIVPPALRSLGNDAAAYAGAYAAAVSQRRVPLTWTVAPTEAAAATVRRARLVAMAVALAMAVAAAIVAPGVRATLIVRKSARPAVAGRDARKEMVRAESDLLRTTQQLTTVARFDASRGAMLWILGQLGQSLPESTAIVSLRVDSVEGSFVAIAPHVTDVLAELGSIDSIQNTRIVGGVTREVVAGTPVERATFRFLRARRPRGARARAAIPTGTKGR